MLKLGRGKAFDHKKKNHPGEFPKHTLVERHTTEAQEDEELIVTQEAFKNRVEVRNNERGRCESEPLSK